MCISGSPQDKRHNKFGRRYPAAAPDAPPSQPWDSGVRPAPPSPSSSKLTLGATAYEGRGRGGRAVTQTPRRPRGYSLEISKANLLLLIAINYTKRSPASAPPTPRRARRRRGLSPILTRTWRLRRGARCPTRRGRDCPHGRWRRLGARV
jgi:hypothetical protein